MDDEKRAINTPWTDLANKASDELRNFITKFKQFKDINTSLLEEITKNIKYYDPKIIFTIFLYI
jgi:hypothetical protein